MKLKVMTLKRLLLLAFFPALLLLASCTGNQENKLIGVWKATRFDALPDEYPFVQWEFTNDNDILKYEVTEIEKKLLSTGQWGFTKRNRLNISKFDEGFNGEWEIVTLKNDVLRMVLKVYVPDPESGEERPAGQVLVEFTKSR
jgi:hypothetical protein